MRKIVLIALIVLISVPAFAEWSGNVSMTEGWEARYEKAWSSGPIQIKVQNVSGYTAVSGTTSEKISVMVHYYDIFRKEINVQTQKLEGPMLNNYIRTITVKEYDYPKDTASLTVEVVCDYR